MTHQHIPQESPTGTSRCLVCATYLGVCTKTHDPRDDWKIPKQRERRHEALADYQRNVWLSKLRADGTPQVPYSEILKQEAQMKMT